MACEIIPEMYLSSTLPETNSEFTPENWWLEDNCFLLGFGLFSPPSYEQPPHGYPFIRPDFSKSDYWHRGTGAVEQRGSWVFPVSLWGICPGANPIVPYHFPYFKGFFMGVVWEWGSHFWGVPGISIDELVQKED